MDRENPIRIALAQVIADLRGRLAIAESALQAADDSFTDAVLSGEVDAVVVPGPDGPAVITLRDADQPYRELVEAMNEGAALITDDGLILYANRQLADLFGLPREQVRGDRFARFIPPDQLPTFRALLSDAALGSPRATLRLRHAGGADFPAQLSLRSLPSSATAAVCLVVTDLTDHERIASALDERDRLVQTIADTLPGILYLFDMVAEQSLYVNGRLESTLGYSPDQLSRWRFADLAELIFHEDRDRLNEHILRLKRSRSGDVLGVEYRVRHADGSWRWLAAWDTVFARDASGRPTQLLGSAQDVTARKRQEDELRLANVNLRMSVDDLRRHSEEVAALSEMGALLQLCRTVEEAYAVIARSARQIFPHDTGMLYIRRQGRDDFEAVAAWGEQAAQAGTFGVDECWALRRGYLFTVEDMGMGLICAHSQPRPGVSALCVPLVAEGEALGVLHLQIPQRTDAAGQPVALRQRQASLQQLATALAEQVALALANVRLRETLRAQAIRDPLTGLFNRRFLEESLDRELNRSRSRRYPVGVIMADVDHFKRINDTLGHDAGDAVLRAIGRSLMALVRADDIACRYGGEEFVLILPTANLAVTVERAELIREAVRQMRLEQDGVPIPTVTISAGVTSIPGEEVSIAAALRKADEALYRAKHNGRDRVELA